MKSEVRVLSRFKQAQSDALDSLAAQVAQEFLLELAGLDLFGEKRISQALVEKGLSAEDLNAIAPEKTAAPMVEALGGLVSRGIWYLLVRPFLVLGRVIRSAGFRQEITAAFKKALRKDLRSSRHLWDVAGRWARGDEVRPQEFLAAKQQLLRILVKVVLVYFATPEVAGLFSGDLWHAISNLGFFSEEVVFLLLDRPLSAVMKKLLTSPTS